MKREPVVSDFPSKLNRLPLYHAYCGGELRSTGPITEYDDHTVVDVMCQSCGAFVCYLEVRKPTIRKKECTCLTK